MQEGQQTIARNLNVKQSTDSREYRKFMKTGSSNAAQILEYMTDIGKHTVNWPACSQDLNPICTKFSSHNNCRA